MQHCSSDLAVSGQIKQERQTQRLTWTRCRSPGSQNGIADHLQRFGEVKVMQNQKVAGRGWDQHFGTVWCQPHTHEKSGVKELLVRTAVFSAPRKREGIRLPPASPWEISERQPYIQGHLLSCKHFSHPLSLLSVLFKKVLLLHHQLTY